MPDVQKHQKVIAEKTLSGWTIEKRGGRTILHSPGADGDGISIAINKTRRVLDVYGWYDGMVGIRGGEIPLDELIALFDKRKASR